MVAHRPTRRSVLFLLFSVSLCLCGAFPLAAQDRVFYVTGFVKTPGSYRYPDEGTINAQQAIALAGGLTEQGSLRGLIIIRKVDGELTEIEATLTSTLEPGDTLRIRRRLQ